MTLRLNHKNYSDSLKRRFTESNGTITIVTMLVEMAVTFGMLTTGMEFLPGSFAKNCVKPERNLQL